MKKINLSILMFFFAANFIFAQCPANLILNNTITSGTDFQEASNIIQASGVINSGAGADYRAGNYLLLSSPFNSKNGSAFRGYIAGCSGIIAVEQLKQISGDSNSFKNVINTFPNPSNGIFKISLNEVSEGTIEISDLYGFNIYKSEFKNQNEFDFNLQDRSKGIYIVKVFSGEQVFTSKIIKN